MIPRVFKASPWPTFLLGLAICALAGCHKAEPDPVAAGGSSGPAAPSGALKNNKEANAPRPGAVHFVPTK